MDHADDDDVFVYMGGDQEVPSNVRYVRVHKSVKIISRQAFRYCYQLVSIELHDGVEIIEEETFSYCSSLRRIKLTGVRVIEDRAFAGCRALESVEFGDKLETIGNNSFRSTALRSIKLPKVRVIESGTFQHCGKLTEAELSKNLERIENGAFDYCPRLRHIFIQLKEDLFDPDDTVFNNCNGLSHVGLIGEIHKTISSLLLESWRNEMKNEIDRINQVLLPNTFHLNKTAVIQQWMRSVIRRIEHYKNEHYALVKEFTTLLELALWKAKLDESQGERSHMCDQPAKKGKIDMKAVRQEKRITSGANIVIKNVLLFLKLE